jgi:hypothetical protein
MGREKNCNLENFIIKIFLWNISFINYKFLLKKKHKSNTKKVTNTTVGRALKPVHKGFKLNSV